MDQINKLTTIVHDAVKGYHTPAMESASYFVADPLQQIYAVFDVPHVPRKEVSAVVVMAKIAGDSVVVVEDLTDRPLYKELIQAGVPREKIVLEYAGEKLADER